MPIHLDERATERNKSLELAAGASIAGIILLGPIGLTAGISCRDGSTWCRKVPSSTSKWPGTRRCGPCPSCLPGADRPPVPRRDRRQNGKTSGRPEAPWRGSGRCLAFRAGLGAGPASFFEDAGTLGPGD